MAVRLWGCGRDPRVKGPERLLPGRRRRGALVTEGKRLQRGRGGRGFPAGCVGLEFVPWCRGAEAGRCLHASPGEPRLLRDRRARFCLAAPRSAAILCAASGVPLALSLLPQLRSARLGCAEGFLPRV